MASKATKTATRPQPDEQADPPAFDNLVELNKDAFKTVDEMTQCAAESFETYGQETLDFVLRRIGQDLAVPQKLVGCWTPQEALGVYLDFIQTAQKDYLEEADRVARIGREIAKATLQMMKIEIAPQVVEAAEEARAKRA